MKGSAKNKSSKKLSCAPRRPRARPFWALIFMALSILNFVSLWDFSSAQSTDNQVNLVGSLGIRIAEWSYAFLGMVAWLIPFYFLWLSYMFLFRKSHLIGWRKGIALIVILVAAAGALNLIEATYMSGKAAFPNGLGGQVGKWTYNQLMESSVGPFGSGVLLALALIFCFSTLLIKDLGTAFDNWLHKVSNWREQRRQARAEARQAAMEKKEAAKQESSIFAKSSPKQEKVQKDINDKAAPIAIEDKPAKRLKVKDRIRDEAQQPELRIIAGEKVEKARFTLPETHGDYQFPDPELLRPPEKPQQRSVENHEERAQALQEVLAQFGINVELGEVHAGPVITRYDIFLAPGVRVEKIVNLDRNIAMSLKAKAVRILAPVPGKGCVGIEIPNHHPMPVCIREILESTAWVDSKAIIPLALGKEVSGRPVVEDLTKMPHLLIAGSTGSGKTVCINAIITSLLYFASPEDLRFIMIDPKIVEMQVFNDLPHMLIPVVTEPKKVPAALKWLLTEMEQRYQIFAKAGVRNIAGFNAKQTAEKKPQETEATLEANLSPEERAAVNSIELTEPDSDIEIPHKLPYIVCIIDELADLMMVAPADIETSIARLAQLARAAGTHLIIATQRPSVNVITGVIKANLPSRIAFKVASKVDSRTILDAGGADHLIGRGDMLFTPPGLAQMVRIQGVFVSDDEINDIVAFLKSNGPPQYAEDVQRQIHEGDTNENGDHQDWEDPLIPDAIEVLRTSKRASTSMLQRRLKIGYNRAARIMDILEQEQIIGPDNGQQPREILKDLDTL